MREKDLAIDSPRSLPSRWRNPRKRRDHLHIIAEILEIARDGAFKTPIMYKANLGFAQLNVYLSFLFQSTLIETVIKNGRTTYKTTPKGLKYLQSYKQIKNLLRKKEQAA